MAKRAELELVGAKELHDLLVKEAPEAADKIAAQAVFDIGKSVESTLFRRLQNMPTKQGTGLLAASLFTVKRKPGPGLVEAQVRGGATRPILLIREFGTSNQPARPAIAPTAEEHRASLPQEMRERFGDLLVKELARRAKKGGG